MLELPPGPCSPAELADALVDQLPAGAQLVVPIANGEPVRLLDEVEARADRLSGVRIHQMHVLHDRPYLHGDHAGHLEHVSWFLSHVTRPAYWAGTCEFAPANFSEVPRLLLEKGPVAVLAAAAPPDDQGYFSLGLSADYAAALIGRVPFVLEVNDQMPRTSGANRLHHSEVAGWCRHSAPLVELPPSGWTAQDEAIAQAVADRIPDGATIQLGIGAIPTAVASALHDHRDLGVHTELLSTPVVDLVESGAVTGLRKHTHRGRVVATFALGTRRLYDFCDRNDTVLFLPVDQVADPRLIGREPHFVSVNATLEVDLLGQCASESLGSKLWSGSGGQADFARGAQYSDGGEGFVVLHSTTRDGASRIVPTLRPGAVVTTLKNTVDNVVTEHGVAELRGCTAAERVRALISIAAPEHRDDLQRSARTLGLLH
jgi:acyl-CoA hydrolase